MVGLAPGYELAVLKDGNEVGCSPLGQKDEIVIGRDPGCCDLVMEHASISRKHASVIARGDGEFYARDLGSVHGTTVDGVRISEEPVKMGTLRLGASTRSIVVREKRETTTSFGKREREKDSDALGARKRREAEIAAMTNEMRGPVAAAIQGQRATTRRRPAESEEEEEEEEEEMDPNRPREESTMVLSRRWGFPVSHEIVLGESSSKTASCLAVDPGGARVLVGSLDNRVRMYDFGGMDKRHKPFRVIEPDVGHSVVALSFSPSGDRFLCCTASSQPQIFTKDGEFLLKFSRGDPYVTDTTKTTGHVTSVTGGQWQPNEKMRCATSSVDGSVRLWDLCGKTGLRDVLFCESTLRCKDKSGRKTAATAVCFSPGGGKKVVVVAGCADGSIQYWTLKGRAHGYSRPDGCIRSAHAPGTDASGCVLSCVKFSPDGRMLASRADDGFLKLWDVHRKKQQSDPLVSFECRGYQATANLDWSPDGAVVCAGDEEGYLRLFSAGDESHEIFKEAGGYSALLSLKVSQGDDRRSRDVPFVSWQPRIRQVFCGIGNGSTKTLYDPELSSKGALLSMKRDHHTRRDAVNDAILANIGHDAIINPNALPMFRNDDAMKRGRYAKTRLDPKLSKIPDKPLEQGQQGRNTGARSTIFQSFMESQLPESIRGQDPREELLKYAHHPPIFRTETTDYKDNRGKQVLAKQTLEQEEDSFLEDQKKLLGFAATNTKKAGGAPTSSSSSSRNH